MGFDGEFTSVMGSEHREYQHIKALGNAWHFPSATWLLLLVLLSMIPSSISCSPIQPSINKVVQLWHHHHHVPFGPEHMIINTCHSLTGCHISHGHRTVHRSLWTRPCLGASSSNTTFTLSASSAKRSFMSYARWSTTCQTTRNYGSKNHRTRADGLSTRSWDHTDSCPLTPTEDDRIPTSRHLATRTLNWLPAAGFPPGVSWYIRTDDKYTSPSSIEELRQHNREYVLKKLKEARVADRHELILDEIISEVDMGRINGPSEAPAEWGIKCVRPQRCPHTLLSFPHESLIIAVVFSISIEQIGLDGKRRYDVVKIGEGADTTERA